MHKTDYPKMQKELGGKFDKIKNVTGSRILIINRYVQERSYCGKYFNGVYVSGVHHFYLTKMINIYIDRVFSILWQEYDRL